MNSRYWRERCTSARYARYRGKYPEHFKAWDSLTHHTNLEEQQVFTFTRFINQLWPDGGVTGSTLALLFWGSIFPKFICTHNTTFQRFQSSGPYVMLFWWRVFISLLSSSVAFLSKLRKCCMADKLDFAVCLGMSSFFTNSSAPGLL